MSTDGRVGDGALASVQPPGPGELASVPASRVHCRVEWLDTDASGHYHHSTVIRWVEAAEAELFRRLGIDALYGNFPRVHYEANYLSRVWFGDEIDLELTVDKVGTSSLRMSFLATAAGQRQVARGRVVMVNAPGENGRAEPWPAHVKETLTGVLG